MLTLDNWRALGTRRNRRLAFSLPCRSVGNRGADALQPGPKHSAIHPKTVPGCGGRGARSACEAVTARHQSAAGPENTATNTQGTAKVSKKGHQRRLVQRRTSGVF